MKIRSDYVTNSSSSNFVIAYRNIPEFDEETLTKYPFLKNYGNLIKAVLFSCGEFDTTRGEVVKSQKELDDYYIDMYSWSKDEDTIEKVLKNHDDLVESYHEALNYLENEFSILFKEVGYSDTYCSDMLHELAKDKDNFVILEKNC